MNRGGRRYSLRNCASAASSRSLVKLLTDAGVADDGIAHVDARVLRQVVERRLRDRQRARRFEAVQRQHQADVEVVPPRIVLRIHVPVRALLHEHAGPAREQRNGKLRVEDQVGVAASRCERRHDLVPVQLAARRQHTRLGVAELAEQMLRLRRVEQDHVARVRVQPQQLAQQLKAVDAEAVLLIQEPPHDSDRALAHRR